VFAVPLLARTLLNKQESLQDDGGQDYGNIANGRVLPDGLGSTWVLDPNCRDSRSLPVKWTKGRVSNRNGLQLNRFSIDGS
jgi:hypothetical protein